MDPLQPSWMRAPSTPSNFVLGGLQPDDGRATAATLGDRSGSLDSMLDPWQNHSEHALKKTTCKRVSSSQLRGPRRDARGVVRLYCGNRFTWTTGFRINDLELGFTQFA